MTAKEFFKNWIEEDKDPCIFKMMEAYAEHVKECATS